MIDQILAVVGPIRRKLLQWLVGQLCVLAAGVGGRLEDVYVTFPDQRIGNLPARGSPGGMNIDTRTECDARFVAPRDIVNPNIELAAFRTGHSHIESVR